jgi:CRP/FNR family transcriptional regulator, cyclic AMP receptor protein
MSERAPTLSERIAFKIVSWSGTMAFLLLNAGAFTLWIVLNTLLPWRLDPFPFNFLTMSVSLEAIFLAILVLMAENRQAELDRVTVEHDAATNRRSLDEIREIKQILTRMVHDGSQS